MKVQVSILAASLAMGMAMAQSTPTNPQNQSAQPPAEQSSSGDTKTSAAPATSNDKPAEMKTSTFKGVLMDMGCGSKASASGAAAANPASAGSATSDSANRSTTDSASSCSPSANSTELGMKLDDGRTVRFDLVGNQRAQDALKNNKSWSKDLAAGKPIHARVSGALSGDKLIVSSIH